MLSYAFQVLNEQCYKNIATEQFNNTGELIPLLKEYWFDEPMKVKDWSENLRSTIK